MTLRQEIGNIGERATEKLYKKQHFSICARNYRSGHYEIDLIVSNQEYLVFVEVKTRTASQGNELFGRPASAVNYHKQQCILSGAKAYLREHPETDRIIRFDVIEVYLSAEGKILQIQQIENAYTA